MTETSKAEPAETPATCSNCNHPAHQPGAECEAGVEHGPSCWHRCLCLNRVNADRACPPQMDCQGGPLGYTDIWYLQRGHTLSGAGGPIAPDVLKTPPAVSSSAPADRAALRDRDRALALLEAADFLRDAHFRDGLSVQEIGTALRHTADAADPMVGSLARDGFGLDEIAAMPDTAAPPAPADRAAVLHQTERDMLSYALDLAQDQMHSRSGEFTAEDQEAVDELRRLTGEARDERETQANTVADEVVAAMYVPCSFPPCDTGPGEPCDTHERLWAHAEGDHELCGPECPADRCTCDSEDHTHDGGCPLYAPADDEQQPEAAEGAQQ
jgi:hypothetical protein